MSPQQEIYGDILHSLDKAVISADEARGIAEAEFGKNDHRTRMIEDAWSECYTARRNILAMKAGHAALANAKP